MQPSDPTKALCLCALAALASDGRVGSPCWRASGPSCAAPQGGGRVVTTQQSAIYAIVAPSEDLLHPLYGRRMHGRTRRQNGVIKCTEGHSSPFDLLPLPFFALFTYKHRQSTQSRRLPHSVQMTLTVTDRT